MTEDRYYETWPDFNAGENEVDSTSRIAHSIELMADPSLGTDAVQLMNMLAFGIKQAGQHSPYLCEDGDNEHQYFQVIRGSLNEYCCELSSPEIAGGAPNQDPRIDLEELGWLMPNEESPNYHREYPEGADRFEIAADAARGWMAAFGKQRTTE